MPKKLTINKTLLKNFTSLSILQISNYLFPLITFPYLVRVLGPDKFGLVNFAAAFVGYFGILTDYGFNLSANRKISIHRNDKRKVNEIFNSVLIIKIILFFISALIICIIIFVIPKFRNEYLTYLFSFGAILGNVLFPVWFFQGNENMKFITILNIIFKSITTLLIFLLVTKSNDYNILVLLNSLSFITIGIFSLIIIRIHFKIKFIIPSGNEIIFHLKEGWYIFISTIGISLYTISNTFILGIFTNNIIVGYYSVAEKIINVLEGIMNPLSQTLYPHLSLLAANSPKEYKSKIPKLSAMLGTIGLIISGLTIIFAPEICKLLLGEQYNQSIIVLRILSPLPFLLSLSIVYANLGLLAFGLLKKWASVILFSSLISVIGAVLFVYVFHLQHIGTAINVTLTESLVLLLSFYTYKKYIAEKI